MLPAFPVELKPYDPNWAHAAEREAERLHTALGEVLVGVHHIGSTSIPGQLAKPIIDLVPVVRSHVTLEAAKGRLEALGYVGHGEFGLAGRRYFVLDAAIGGSYSCTATKKETQPSCAIWRSAIT